MRKMLVMLVASLIGLVAIPEASMASSPGYSARPAVDGPQTAVTVLHSTALVRWVCATHPKASSNPACKYRKTLKTGVDRWRSTALAAGWKSYEWPWLRCVIRRESGGNQYAFNGRRRDRSYGLMQINARAHHSAMIKFAGSESAFFNPYVNLKFARKLYLIAGKSPWRSRHNPC